MSATEKALAAAAVEVVAKAKRRRFTAEYKCRILREADGCKTPGAVGALLRREGLYSSHLTTWRAARDRGELAGAPKKRGPIPQGPDPRDKIAELAREAAQWRRRAERAEALFEVQKNSRCCWGRRSKPSTPNGEDHGAWAATWHRAHVCRVGRGAGDLLPPTPTSLRPASATSLHARPQR
jgi:transposase-like protein